MIVSPEQIKAARMLLGWTRKDLIKATLLSPRTVADIEDSEDCLPNSLLVIRAALESAGVEFTHGGQPGVRMSQKSAKR